MPHCKPSFRRLLVPAIALLAARSISKYRPRCPILGVSAWPAVVRAFALNWGITGLLFEGDVAHSNEDAIAFAVRKAKDLGMARPGEVCVVTAGRSRESGSTNLIRVVGVE